MYHTIQFYEQTNKQSNSTFLFYLTTVLYHFEIFEVEIRMFARISM